MPHRRVEKSNKAFPDAPALKASLPVPRVYRETTRIAFPGLRAGKNGPEERDTFDGLNSRSYFPRAFPIVPAGINGICRSVSERPGALCALEPVCTRNARLLL